jgi:hypothetical protein
MLVLDEVALHAGFFGGLEDGGPVDHAGADRHARLVGRAPVGLAHLDALRDVLHVRERDAAGILLEERHGIAAAAAHPEDVGLERDRGRVGLLRERVEQRALGRRLKLVAVDVVDEADPRGLRGRAPLVEALRGTQAVLAREDLLVRDPGEPGVADAEVARALHDRARVLAPVLVAVEGARDAETRLLQLGQEARRPELVVAAALDLAEAHRADRRERAGHVLRHALAQAVELEAHGLAVDARAVVHRGVQRARQRGSGGEGGETSQEIPARSVAHGSRPRSSGF